MKTITFQAMLLGFLFYCWGINDAFATVPNPSSPADQSINLSLTPNLLWSSTGSSYTVEIYNCDPDYSKTGELDLGNYSLDAINLNVANVAANLSGATYNPQTNSSFYVLNGPDVHGKERIIELDNNGVWLREILFHGFEDPEGIVWIGGDDYLIVEEKRKRIIKVSIDANTSYIPYPADYIQLDISSCPNNDCLEGISYDAYTNQVILANEKQPQPEIYVFTLPAIILGVDSITPTQPFDAQTMLGVLDLSGLHHLSLTEGISGLNISDHFLALSDDSKVLVETDLNGTIYGSLHLKKDSAGLSSHVFQPEGITMDNLGNIYIAGEQDDFYKFSNTALDLNPFGLDPTALYTNSNVNTNSVLVPAGTLSQNTDYCWRVRDNSTGAWSDYYSFTTGIFDCSITDSLALLSVFYATDGLNWTNTWDINQPVNTWYGVTMGAGGCVTELDLANNNLTGIIPDQLCDLLDLSILDLSQNNLSGSIPVDLANLPNLTSVSLSDNLLSGCYNPGLAGLCSIANNQSISDGNNFDVPWEYYCNTGEIACTGCGLSDYHALVAFANAITDWGTAIQWDLNQPLSTWEGITLLFDGCVRTIDLTGKNISGTLVPELGSISGLYTLYLGNNNFSGPIPSELGGLEKLRWLNLGNNALSGPIPPELGNLINPVTFNLSGNQLSGSIPAELGNLSNISIQLQNNQLSGCYPNDLLSLCGSGSNSTISDGNNLMMPWDIFCQTFLGSCSPVVCPDLQDQYEALSAFYFANGGDNWSGGASWPTEAFFNANPIAPAGISFASWYGVTVNGDGCVTGLYYDDDNINGTIPPEIGQLSTLISLDLSSNNYSGSLPPELGNLTNLEHIDISSNNISGPIPPELGNLSSLEVMYFNYNNLSGNIPTELGSLGSIETLAIAGNQLSGDIPNELGNLLYLVYLRLDGNQLTGSIPASFSTLPSLTNLALQVNQLSGCYDPSLQSLCSQLDSFANSNSYISNGNNFDEPWEDFCNSGLGACIPFCASDYNAMIAFYNAITDWGSMSPWDTTQSMNTWEGITLNAAGCVEAINIDEEYIVGMIPPEIGDLSSLMILELEDNSFTGPIPPEIGNLSNLVFLNLSGNNLTGSIPPELGNLSSLTAAYLNYNNLSGMIPPEIGDLINIQTLSLNSNQLSGDLPFEIGDLDNLITLSLSDNQLTGSIPPEIATFTNLSVLALNNNQMSGCYDIQLLYLCNQMNPFTSTNGYISDGNNFDADWEDFCSSGSGNCCPNDLIIFIDSCYTGDYRAGQTIISQGDIVIVGEVDFRAGDEILLENGFSVELGAILTAEVGVACGD